MAREVVSGGDGLIRSSIPRRRGRERDLAQSCVMGMSTSRDGFPLQLQHTRCSYASTTEEHRTEYEVGVRRTLTLQR
jgi:hypothetical protein